MFSFSWSLATRLARLSVALPSVVPAAALAADADCAATTRQVSRQVAARPERVLVIVEDTLVVSDSCACEVVKSAIVAASASPKLTGQIVFVAVNIAPTKAVLISECATAASPDAASEIAAAVRKALGTEAGARAPAASSAVVAPPTTADSDGGEKNPIPDPKNPRTTPAESEREADFGLSPVAIGGVYLVYPGSGGSPQVIRGQNGKLYYIGPKGQRIPLDPEPPTTTRPARPPAIIIIRPPTPTDSDGIPVEPIPIPIEPTPNEPSP